MKGMEKDKTDMKGRCQGGDGREMCETDGTDERQRGVLSQRREDMAVGSWMQNDTRTAKRVGHWYFDSERRHRAGRE